MEKTYSTAELVKAYKCKLSTDSSVIVKGLLEIYGNQTRDEQCSKSVHCDNGIGFTGTDANVLSGIAQQYIEKQFISDKQMQLLKSRMPKYAKQLLNSRLGVLFERCGRRWKVIVK